jgi:hypothetical protein
MMPNNLDYFVISIKYDLEAFESVSFSSNIPPKLFSTSILSLLVAKY